MLKGSAAFALLALVLALGTCQHLRKLRAAERFATEDRRRHRGVRSTSYPLDPALGGPRAGPCSLPKWRHRAGACRLPAVARGTRDETVAAQCSSWFLLSGVMSSRARYAAAAIYGPLFGLSDAQLAWRAIGRNFGTRSTRRIRTQLDNS